MAAFARTYSDCRQFEPIGGGLFDRLPVADIVLHVPSASVLVRDVDSSARLALLFIAKQALLAPDP